VRRLTTLLAFLILSVPALMAQQSRFDEATFLLEKQEYREALNLYKTIADDGNISGALWLNMGIIYARLDSLGMSKYYLLQAEKYPETRELAEEALSYVNERFSRRSAVLPPLPWDRFFNYLSESVGITWLFALAFFFLYSGVAFLITSWFTRSYKKPLNYSASGLLVISVLIFASAFYVHYLDNRFGTGVLIDRQSTVYEAPDAESVEVSTAYEGYTMRVDFKRSSETDNWSYVRLENGRYGWVDTDALRVF
jgi:hypothetical protein